MKLLVVASDTTSPLSTAAPVPTDGQAEWWRCWVCGRRERAAWWGCGNDMREDGPYPFTVGRWGEVEVPCDGFCVSGPCNGVCPRKVGAVSHLVEVTGSSHHADDRRERYLGDWKGNCHDDHGDVRTRIPHEHTRAWEYRYCHPDARPDCWHTETDPDTVIVLDVPIPMERPRMCGCPGNCGKTVEEAKRESVANPGMFNRDQCEDMVGRMAVPAVSWWAELDREMGE